MTLAGVLYLVGFFMADRRPGLSRLGLMIGGLAHPALGLGSGILVDAQQAAPAPLAMLIDLVPAVLAPVAAFLSGSTATRCELASPELTVRISAGR